MNDNNTLICTKYLQLLFFSLVLFIVACSPQNKSERPSPPASDSITVNGARLKIDYSSPGVKERKIWDGLVPYFRIWRTGANEATVFSTSKDLVIQGDTLQAGKYALFTIPSEDKWTLIFNNEWDQWGAYNYDETRDVLRVDIMPKMIEEHQERMKFSFEGSSLRFHWEYLTFSVDFRVL